CQPAAPSASPARTHGIRSGASEIAVIEHPASVRSLQASMRGAGMDDRVPSFAEIAASPDQDLAWVNALCVRGDRSDEEDAVWLRNAAEAGIAPAMFTYAQFLEEVLEDFAGAERWYATSAAAGFPLALY